MYFRVFYSVKLNMLIILTFINRVLVDYKTTIKSHDWCLAALLVLLGDGELLDALQTHCCGEGITRNIKR